MRNSVRIFLSIAAIFALIAFFTVPPAERSVFGTESGEPVHCADERQLLEQLQDGGGGTVILNGDIEWSQYVPELVITEPTTVEMGPYGIHIMKDGLLTVEGPLEFVGEGTSKPLFNVDGGLYTGDGVRITTHGEAATAILMQRSRSAAEGGYRVGKWESYMTEVRVRGDHSTAVRILWENGGTSDPDYRLEMYPALIEAKGRGSVGVDSQVPVRLLGCSVLGGETAVKAPDIILQGCEISPQTSEAKVVELAAVPSGRRVQNGLCVKLGSGATQLTQVIDDLGNASWYSLCDEEGAVVSDHFMAKGVYKGFPQSADTAGQWAIQFERETFPDWFPIEIPDFSFPFYVVDPDQPFLMDAQDAGSTSALIRFFSPISGAEQVKVYYREKPEDGLPKSGGAMDWQDVELLPGTQVTENAAMVESLPINHTYEFQLFVKGGPMDGESNVLEFPFYDNVFENGGGERDDSGRGDQGEELPPDRNQSSGGHRRTGNSASSDPAEQILTAEQVKALIEAYPEGITFLAEGIKATVPVTLLTAAVLPGSKPFGVELSLLGDDRFHLRLRTGDEVIEHFEEEPVVVEIQNGKDQPAQTFQVTGSGEYEVRRGQAVLTGNAKDAGPDGFSSEPTEPAEHDDSAAADSPSIQQGDKPVNEAGSRLPVWPFVVAGVIAAGIAVGLCAWKRVLKRG